MEIISIVVQSETIHKDSMGNTKAVRANDVQRMTAGTVLQQSEWNHGNTPVAYFQI